MSLLHTQDGTVIIVKDGHVVSARTVEGALAELRRRKASSASARKQGVAA